MPRREISKEEFVAYVEGMQVEYATMVQPPCYLYFRERGANGWPKTLAIQDQDEGPGSPERYFILDEASDRRSTVAGSPPQKYYVAVLEKARAIVKLHADQGGDSEALALLIADALQDAAIALEEACYEHGRLGERLDTLRSRFLKDPLDP
jgi:hypothetical protein